MIRGPKIRKSFLLLTRAKLVHDEKCLMFMVVHVLYVPLAIYAFIIEAAHFRTVSGWPSWVVI